MKIKELTVGDHCSIPLLVVSATKRETKAKKPYLQLEFTDGIDKINGNYWDWAGTKIPERNAILNVVGTTTEWQGTKQINIVAMTTNTEMHLSEFLPSSGSDVAEVYKHAYAFADGLSDNYLRGLCLGILEELQGLWLTVPAANSIHHAYVAGTLIHSLSTARLAKVLAETIPEANVELAMAGGLLHDIGKLFGYKMDGVVCMMTDEGMLFEHLHMGAEFVDNYSDGLIKTEADAAKLQIIRHIILSHHGKLEYGAVVTPACIEAHIVYHADTLDATTEMIRVAGGKAASAKWTEKIWALENKPHLNPEYIQVVMLS